MADYISTWFIINSDLNLCFAVLTEKGFCGFGKVYFVNLLKNKILQKKNCFVNLGGFDDCYLALLETMHLKSVSISCYVVLHMLISRLGNDSFFLPFLFHKFLV